MNKINKKYIFWIVFFLIIIAGAGMAYYQKSRTSLSCQIAIAKRTNLKQVVSLTGRVKSNQKINLSFEKSGRISHIYVKNNDNVESGQPLLELDNQDLKIKLSQAKSRAEGNKIALLQAQAQLKSQLAKLEKMKKGTRVEEIDLAKTKVSNYQQQLIQTKKDLEATKSKAEADLRNVYITTLSYLPSAVDLGKNALYQLSDLQINYFNDYSQESLQIIQDKAVAVKLLLGKENAGRWDKKSLSRLHGGASGDVEFAENNPTPQNIDLAVSKTVEALRKIRIVLNEVISLSQLPSSEATNLSTERNSLDNKIIILIGQQQAIHVQKENNQLTISTAEIKLTQVQSNLAIAKSELLVKESGYNPEDINSQQAEVEKTRADIEWEEYQIQQAIDDVRYYQNEIQKTILESPINGIVVNQNDLQIGEMVLAGAPIISIISRNKFKVEAYVSESDINKVKVGDQANITLDAYGDSKIFLAKVIKIDLGETMIEGVASYKTTLEFDSNEIKIKPGMTANIDILTANKQGVITLPWRSIIEKDGQKLVKTIQGGKVKEVEIETGLYGSEGQVEIIKGIKEGEKICLP